MMNEDIRLYSNKTGKGMGLMYGFLLLAMLFFGVPLWVELQSYSTEADSLFLKLWILLFSLFALFLISGVFMNMVHAFRFAGKPVLTFNALGIVDYTRIFPVGLIRWDEIAEIFPCEFLTSSGATRRLIKVAGMGIGLRDRRAFMSRYGFIVRTMIRLKSWPGYYIIQTRSIMFENDDLDTFIGTLGGKFRVKVGIPRKVGDGK